MEKILAILPSNKSELVQQVFADYVSHAKDMDYRVNPPIHNPQCIQYLNNEYKFKENDVIVVSFPKTGKCLQHC